MARGIKADAPIERTCLPVEEWPELDRRLWADAITPAADMFDDGGARSGRRPATNKNVAKSYGRWLHWLQETGQLDPCEPPGPRITPDRVRAFIEQLLAAGNQPSTLSQRITELRAAACAIVPQMNWDWLKTPARNLRNKAAPKRKESIVLPDADEVVDLGFYLMAAGLNASDPGQRAVLYRDGLMIAFLALQPLRLSNLAGLVIGETLHRVGHNWTFSFSEQQTKTHRPIEGTWPSCLNEALATYLSTFRPLLARRRRTSTKDAGQNLWLSAEGIPLSQKRIQYAIKLRTKEHFGIEISPHQFRAIAATTLVYLLPENARAAAPLLHHISFGTTANHYIRGDVRRAQAVYIEALRQAG